MSEQINLNKGYAPYNFIDLPKRVFKRYESYKTLPRHDRFEQGTLRGNIEYEIEIETPTIVCKEEKDKSDVKSFCKNALGQYIIPGSTLKGMLSTNVAVLGQGIIGDYVENQRFLYRSIADRSGKLREDYKNRMGLRPCRDPKTGKPYSILEKVKAGYIYKIKDKQYKIIPAKEIKGNTYFRINELIVKKEKMPIHNMHFLEDGRNSYMPYTVAVKYDLNEQSKHVKYVCDRKANNICKYEGYLLGSGFMNGKHAHYVINDVNEEADEIEITQEEMRAYQYDIKKNANIRKSEFYNLPEQVGKEYMRPIFYIRYDEVTYFGFTPALRLFYDHTIYDGIPDEQLDPNIMDYTRSMFGFADLRIGNDEKATNGDRPVSYKSRIQVEDAIAVKVAEGKEYQMVLGGPKATCLPHYIKQRSYDKGSLISYNDNDFEIRGIKCYWLKDTINPEKMNKSNVDISVKPLSKGTIFKGNISFDNLFPDELGLLLWGLSLEFDNEKKSFQNIGLGKSYGFGRVSIKNIQLKLIDVCKKYTSFNMNYEEKPEYSQYIQSYKDYVSKEFGCKVDELRQINGFKIMKTSIVSSRQKEFQYMPIGMFKCKAVLPSIMEIKDNNFKYVKEVASSHNNYKKTGKGDYTKNKQRQKRIFTEQKHGNDVFDLSKLKK